MRMRKYLKVFEKEFEQVRAVAWCGVPSVYVATKSTSLRLTSPSFYPCQWRLYKHYSMHDRYGLEMDNGLFPNALPFSLLLLATRPPCLTRCRHSPRLYQMQTWI